jgi:hypothetical protein
MTWAVVVVVATVLVVAADGVIPIVANEVMTTTPSCDPFAFVPSYSITP